MSSIDDQFRRILGIRFFVGDLESLFKYVKRGGLIVVPSAPVLAELPNNPSHRQALVESDLALTDSGLLVLIWLVLKRERLPRISGLRFLRALLERSEFHRPGSTYWIMPSTEDAKVNCDWLGRKGLVVTESDWYAAPLYPSGPLEDPGLLARLEIRKPNLVVINLGGGVQERLGYYLRNHLSYRPAIICTGAAIAFLSGRQVQIPAWADRLMLGWLLRILHSPAKFIPRYWNSLRLVRLLIETETQKS